MKLDQKDARILNALQKDARLTGEDLGPAVHLSAAACNRRIKRLRDDGIIVKTGLAIPVEPQG